MADAPHGVDAAHVVSANDLVMLQDVAGLSLSPDGREFIFQLQQADAAANLYHSEWRIGQTDVPGVVRLVVDGGEPIFAENRDGRVVGVRIAPRPEWSPDSAHVAFVRKIAGRLQLWMASRSQPGAVPLVQGSGDVGRYVWSAVGRFIVCELKKARSETGPIPSPQSRDGYRLDDRFDLWFSRGPVRGRIEDVPGQDQTLKIDWMSRLVVPASEQDERSLDNAGQPFIYRYRARTVALFDTQETSLPASLASDIHSAPGVRLLVRHGDAMTAWAQIADPRYTGYGARLRLNASGLTQRGISSYVCAPSACEGLISEIWLTPDSRQVAFSRWEGWANGTLAFYSWNLARGTVRTISRSDDVYADCQIQNDFALCFHESATRPRSIVRLDIASGKTTEIYDPNPNWRHLRVCPVQRIEFEDEFQNPAFGYYVHACGRTDGGRAPLVVTGYRAKGFLRGGVGDEYPVQAFAGAGIGVFVYDNPDEWQADAEISDSRQLEQRSWENFHYRRSTWSAVRRGIEMLIRRGGVDAQAIGLMGLSDAALTTAWGVIHDGPFAAAILSTPVWEPTEFYFGGASFFQQEMPNWGLGLPGSVHGNAWPEISLALNANRIRTPILANLADREAIRFMQTKTTLEALRRPVEAYLYADEFHDKWQPAHRAAIYERNIDWMRFWLQGIEDPASAKQVQYQRWRELRGLRDARAASVEAAGADQ